VALARLWNLGVGRQLVCRLRESGVWTLARRSIGVGGLVHTAYAVETKVSTPLLGGRLPPPGAAPIPPSAWAERLCIAQARGHGSGNAEGGISGHVILFSVSDG
jgi:hypothetical protein